MKNRKLIFIVLGIAILVLIIGIVYCYINNKQDFQQQNNLIEENFKANTETDVQTNQKQNLEIVFYDNPTSSSEDLNIVLDEKETDKYSYTIYSYQGKVNIIIDGKEISLRNALLNNKVTMEEIMEKADRDFPNTISYDDGGSREYRYDNYTLIKMNALGGNRDVYIAKANTTLNDIPIVNYYREFKTFVEE